MRAGLFILSLFCCIKAYSFEFVKKSHHPALATSGIGVFNILREQQVFQFSFEYKFKTEVLKARPFVGMFVTTQAATYFYAGIGWDIYFLHHLVFTPSFAPGIWQDGYGKKLGFPLEFRSSLELAYVLKNKGRLGAQFYHISNASLGHKNPGDESFVIFYSHPLY